MTNRKNKLDFIKISNFCISKSIKVVLKKNKKQNEVKLFANHVFDKGLISRTYKELLQLINKKTNSLKGNVIEWTFFQRRYTNGHRGT